MNAIRAGLVCALIALLSVVMACNDHVFYKAWVSASPSGVVERKIDVDRAADILFVVDNSGSMAEEQANLARNVSSSDDVNSACNSAGFTELTTYVDANPSLRRDAWEPAYQSIYAQCGFIERLQLYQNRFQIGVMTTDMSDCDGAYATPARGSVPQRGCLQSSAQEPDLTVLRWDTPDLARRFANIITSVGTEGSPYEKGLEATRHFLSPGHNTPPAGSCDLARDCSGDLDAFLRQGDTNAHGDEVETKLIVIFLSDEEDCSDAGRIAAAGDLDTQACYERPDLLTDTAGFADFFAGLKSRPELTSIAVIAGLHDDGGGMQPSGCKLIDGSASDACDPARGNSISTCTTVTNGAPVCVCHGHIDGYDDTNCCQADAAYRYVEVARQMPSFKLDTLCSTSYRDTMIEIADLVNLVDSVQLSEPVAGAESIVVSISGARWNGAWVDVPYYDPALGLPEGGGWSLAPTRDRILFHLDWVPEPGDEVRVMYRGL